VNAFVISARRTAVVPRGGAFARLGMVDLAVPVVTACLADAGIAAGEVDEVVVSNALGAGGNVARLVALASGLPERVAGLTIDRQCAGGLDALLLARALVASGAAEVVIAGGVESYSRRPLRFRTDPEGGAAVPYDRPPFTPWPERDPDMHAAAEALAHRLAIGREAQDLWAVGSHAKALARGNFPGEIVGLAGQGSDAFARRLSVETAGRAKALCGSITAANAAVAADGAAFVVVVSERRAKAARRALRIVGGATLGGRPDEPGLAPVLAIGEVLRAARLADRGRGDAGGTAGRAGIGAGAGDWRGSAAGRPAAREPDGRGSHGGLCGAGACLHSARGAGPGNGQPWRRGFGAGASDWRVGGCAGGQAVSRLAGGAWIGGNCSGGRDRDGGAVRGRVAIARPAFMWIFWPEWAAFRRPG
jgi:acetyl-CoA C-acetyltransferase